MIKILRAVHQSEYRIELQFSTREIGAVDLADLVSRSGTMVQPLRDAATFRSFFVELGALAWPSGFELSAESLYGRAKAAGTLRPDRAA